MKIQENVISHEVLGLALKVHKTLGPGLLESSYEACLAYELEKSGMHFQRQKPLPLYYEDVKLNHGYRVDLLIENRVIVEVKAVDALHEIHKAQLLTYLKLSDKKLGLLINFNVPLLKNGIKRLVHNL
jgi:GxxExxY protein